jgi:hypothetical protein
MLPSADSFVHRGRRLLNGAPRLQEQLVRLGDESRTA